MKNKSLITIVVLFLFLLFISLIFYRYYYFQGSQTIIMQFEVSEKLAFNTDTDALYFGKGMPGTQTKRDLLVNNTFEYPINVLIKIEGDISQFASVSKNDFIMQAGENTVVTYYIKSKPETEYGNYSGFTTLVYTRPLFD